MKGGKDTDFGIAGDLLRLLAEARAREKAPELDVLWTRVRAGIEEERAARARSRRLWKWAWLPAAALLAVLAVLFYPSGVNRDPFHPGSFDVSVESVESDAGTVAVFDRGNEYPRVIWIVEDGRS